MRGQEKEVKMPQQYIYPLFSYKTIITWKGGLYDTDLPNFLT